jgi:hypothetical protein
MPNSDNVRYTCMPNAACVDVSSDTDPATQCVCQMGKRFAADGVTCIDPPPTTPTPRPIPTMKPATKSITTGKYLVCDYKRKKKNYVNHLL